MENISAQPAASLAKPKSIKLHSDCPSPYFFNTTKYNKQIKPIPLVYKKIGYQGDSKFLYKISAKGDKYVSRVAASGEHTVEILEKIKKTSYLKLVRNLEFDPYFCNTSGLKPLSQVMKMLARSIFNVNLAFRRTTERNEIEQFALFLTRLNKITRLKIDILNQSGIDSQNFKNLTRSCRRFTSLKVADINIGGSKDIFRNIYKVRDIYGASPFLLEKIRFCVSFSHTQLSTSEPSPKELARRRRKLKFMKNLKFMSLKFSFKTGWASYFDGVELGLGLQAYLQRLPIFSNPIHFSIAFDKVQVPVNVLKELSNVLQRLTNLRFVNIELNNVKLSEFELILLAKGLVESKQIERLTFKYLDNVTIPMADILQFIAIIAAHSSFSKFDLFFKKLFYPEWQTPEAERKLTELKGVTYVLTKRSIHIQKLQPIEEGV